MKQEQPEEQEEQPERGKRGYRDRGGIDYGKWRRQATTTTAWIIIERMESQRLNVETVAEAIGTNRARFHYFLFTRQPGQTTLRASEIHAIATFLGESAIELLTHFRLEEYVDKGVEPTRQQYEAAVQDAWIVHIIDMCMEVPVEERGHMEELIAGEKRLLMREGRRKAKTTKKEETIHERYSECEEVCSS